MRKLILAYLLSVIFLSFAACSVYKSEGRDCIEKSCSPIYTAASLSLLQITNYCHQTVDEPEFLRESLDPYPLSKVEVEIGMKAYILPRNEGRYWLGVYMNSPLTTKHQWCQFMFLNKESFDVLSDPAIENSFQYFQAYAL